MFIIKEFEKLIWEEETNTLYKAHIKEGFSIKHWSLILSTIITWLGALAIIAVGIALPVTLHDNTLYGIIGFLIPWLLFKWLFNQMCREIFLVDFIEQTTLPFQQAMRVANNEELQKANDWRAQHPLEEACRKAMEDGESQLFIKQYMEKIKNCLVGLDEEELKR